MSDPLEQDISTCILGTALRLAFGKNSCSINDDSVKGTRAFCMLGVAEEGKRSGKHTRYDHGFWLENKLEKSHKTTLDSFGPSGLLSQHTTSSRNKSISKKEEAQEKG